MLVCYANAAERMKISNGLMPMARSYQRFFLAATVAVKAHFEAKSSIGRLLYSMKQGAKSRVDSATVRCMIKIKVKW